MSTLGATEPTGSKRIYTESKIMFYLGTACCWFSSDLLPKRWHRITLSRTNQAQLITDSCQRYGYLVF